MRDRYEDIRGWLNEDAELTRRAHEKRWHQRPLTDAEVAALMAMMAALVGLVMVAVWVLR